MKEKTIKKLELNTKKLENFDKIMSTKLDEIEELKVTGLDKGSELLNIISLCANVKTLIIEGDSRLDSDKVLANVFKPRNLENLILNAVKLPSSNILKRCTNLKRISLSDIRFCDIQDFLTGIAQPSEIEMVNISNTDMGNQSIKALEKFKNLKYLKLKNLQNCKFDLKFLKNNENLLKIDLIDNALPTCQLKYIIDCKCARNIAINMINSDETKIGNCKIETEKNIAEIAVLINYLEDIANKVSWRKMKKVDVIANEMVQDFDFIEILQKIKTNVHVILFDFSCLTTEHAREIKHILGLENFEFANEKGVTKFNIEDYIEIRQEIESAIANVPENFSKPEKFLKIYQYLGKEFEISEEYPGITDRVCTTFQMCQLLQDCLNCVHINSNIIFGKESEDDKKHYWNQVELDGKWYNLDLVLDMENIKKNKTQYCLLGDTDFFETHTPKSGKNNYCPENFNEKLIHVFFKTGLFKENLVASYIEVMIEKIKKLFRINKTLTLPEAQKSEDGEN